MVRSALSFLVLYLLINSFFIGSVNATISDCGASVSSVSMTPSATEDLNFNVTNGSDVTANWIKVTRPSGNFTINSYTIPDRTVSQNANDVTITGGDLPAGFGTSLTINVTAGSSEAGSANWTVQLSDDGGATTKDCTGSLGTAISSTVADTTAPTISAIVVSDVTDSSVKIAWTTDESSNTSVDYGTTDAYGSTATGDSSVTSHAVTIGSLSANTVYHYNVKSKDAAGNEAASGDNTFTTAKTGYTGTTTTGTTTTSTTTTTTTVKATPKPTPRPDTLPPVISLDLDFAKPFKETPKISGKVTDRDSGGVGGGVSKIEYSTDAGKNWLAVDNIKNPGIKSTTFDFTPAIFEDGNYAIKIKATDLSGNSGYSGVETLVIDRLPPMTGGILFSIGPQVLSPAGEGVIFALTGLEEKITLSAVGGPTGIDILANGKTVSLIKNSDNGLWSGALSFSDPGVYQLTAKSVDGANNRTERKLDTIMVLDSGVVKDSRGQAISNAQVSLYYLEPSINQFVLWDGRSFGQTNPQKTDSGGRYQLIAPAGEYYLQISAPGYSSLKTNIFTINKTMPVNTQFVLLDFKGIQIGPFKIGIPGRSEQVIVKFTYPNLPDGFSANLAGKALPFFSFKTDLKDVTGDSFKGKPTVLTFLSLWSPNTFEQLSILDSLQNNKEINSTAVMSQDTDSKVSIFKKIGGYKTPIIADADGILVLPLNILNLPTHVFLDRKGIVRKVRVGVLTREEVLDSLVN